MSADAPIEVWQAPVDVQHARDPRPLLRTLAPEERRRAASGTSRAVRWAAGRSALRVILARYLGSDPATIAFEHGPHGKPSVTGGPEFSFSASGGMALVAVSPAGPVGVDVERIRPRAAGRIARSRFAAAERTALAARGPRAGQAAFHRCWAAKEAYAKGLGRGLALGLDRYSVAGLVGPEATARCAVEHPGRSGEPWEVERLPAAAGYAAAIAAAGPAWRAELRPYPGPEGRDG